MSPPLAKFVSRLNWIYHTTIYLLCNYSFEFIIFVVADLLSIFFFYCLYIFAISEFYPCLFF